MKKFLKWLGIIVGVLLVVDIAAGMYFFHVAEVRSPKSFISADAQVSKSNPTYKNQEWYKTVNKQHWTMKSAGGDLKLDANFIPAEHKTNKTAILVHGFMNSKKNVGAAAGMFHQMGYNVLAPDDRAHGQSQGKFIGYGWLDRKDYVKWMNLLLHKEGQNQQLVMWGISMGGATVMMTSGQKDVPHQLKAYIEDCGYTSVDDEITYQAKEMYHLPKWPLVPTVSAISQIRAGYNYSEASSVKQLHKNTRPMLFIHGTDDTFVPTKMINQVYDATKGPKEKLLIKGAKHAQSIEKDYPLYQKTVEKFLGRYVK
ncbi:alpha/beta hydrolase [Pediococcus claussenii]|uniref:Prolyl oligopeptidase family protein n=1 Tax=Pediococcus claussenii (strain ATCC BAA-344 / DSM 14800 / JCM 18046 / KCTC 3811 / LMG 21948 / P06) TaxID=701521 RepID=G8PF25_PEDCP|nr:alpha/beta hydrolase [Pediococcus claussenii]AEV95704.1 prolyl oligopeptidase family protein [Pediococcus claussenii ATCC BAA-344]ANZ69213.1 alpha/beta hydrolase [Pediococcus claussenii]ANZ71032.1 alpha/beta hydrolase [Pediococcus claussenii]KRN20063.1 hypothetical protein IV79_GL000727 [Pediococcus claussenii]